MLKMMIMKVTMIVKVMIVKVKTLTANVSVKIIKKERISPRSRYSSVCVVGLRGDPVIE